MIRSTTAIIAATLALAATAASAQEPAAAAPEETPFVTLTGTAAFATDYRFRGVSLSDRDIVGQASLTATTAPGFFVGIWGSTIQSYGPNPSNGSNGAEQEIDLTGGFTKTFGAITPSVGVIGYIYPGGTAVDYYEVFGSVAGAVGPAAVTVGVNYAPNQGNTTEDNFYVYALAAVAIPDTPITIKASIGREKGFFDYGETKLDYMAGVDFKYKFVTFGIQYVGNDLSKPKNNPSFRHIAKNGIVGSITAAF